MFYIVGKKKGAKRFNRYSGEGFCINIIHCMFWDREDPCRLCCKDLNKYNPAYIFEVRQQNLPKYSILYNTQTKTR